MPSASELRVELKAMRKDHPDHVPVSKMKKNDISELIQKMKLKLEENPPVAAVASAPAKTYTSAVESIKEAKSKEFPIAIKEKAVKKVTKKAPVVKKAKNVVAEVVSEAKAGRPAKGSDAAKAKMAAIRSSKIKKDV